MSPIKRFESGEIAKLFGQPEISNSLFGTIEERLARSFIGIIKNFHNAHRQNLELPAVINIIKSYIVDDPNGDVLWETRKMFFKEYPELGECDLKSLCNDDKWCLAITEIKRNYLTGLGTDLKIYSDDIRIFFDNIMEYGFKKLR